MTRIQQVSAASGFGIISPVILKILKPARITPFGLSRFHNEYEVARLLHTDRIIKIHSLEAHDQTLVLVCEDFDGTRLDLLMKQWRQEGREPIPLRLVLSIAGQIVDCLAKIHSAGAICSDLHPSGIVLTSRPTCSKSGISALLPP